MLLEKCKAVKVPKESKYLGSNLFEVKMPSRGEIYAAIEELCAAIEEQKLKVLALIRLPAISLQEYYRLVIAVDFED